MFAQIYKGFGLHRFWNCLAAFDGAAVRVLSVLVAVLLMSVSFIPGDATARSDDEVYPVDATLLRAPAHRFSTPPVNVNLNSLEDFVTTYKTACLQFVPFHCAAGKTAV